MRSRSIHRSIALTCLLAACGGAQSPPIAPTETAPDAWRTWRERRETSIAGEDGWLTLIGLHWLPEGDWSLGSDPGATIVLPADRAPARAGWLAVGDGGVDFVPQLEGAVTLAGTPVIDPIPLRPDVPGPPTILELGSLRMHVIARGDRLGLRVKDRASPARASFHGIPVFDYDPRYRVRARFEPAAEGEGLPIANVLGQVEDVPLAGRLRFELEGQSLVLLTTLEGETLAEGLGVMLRDTTSGEETYGAGRYLEVEAPDAESRTTIDFNLAYTPPCGFTDHATCPLPPPENELPIAIRAGERDAH